MKKYFLLLAFTITNLYGSKWSVTNGSHANAYIGKKDNVTVRVEYINSYSGTETIDGRKTQLTANRAQELFNKFSKEYSEHIQILMEKELIKRFYKK